MRRLTVLGVVLMLLGGYILILGMSYPANRSVLKVGEFEAKLEERRSVPPWAGGAAIVGGLVLIGLGVRGRRGA